MGFTASDAVQGAKVVDASAVVVAASCLELVAAHLA